MKSVCVETFEDVASSFCFFASSQLLSFSDWLVLMAAVLQPAMVSCLVVNPVCETHQHRDTMELRSCAELSALPSSVLLDV